MDNEIKSRKKQMVDSFVDTGVDAVTEWTNDFIKTNIPKALDFVTSHIKGLFSSIANKNNLLIGENIQKIIFTGIERGEENKEQALIKAMAAEGISEKKIKHILEKSSQYQISIEEMKK